jgi:2-polyprenyl-3-methyl-5-hydroxy-6-metoxy-1,4-benzoquinol methylase
MGNALKGQPEHSAEFFGDTRDHWWNDDFITLCARRWNLAGTRSILDVGCGVGHWSRVLARVLPPDARLIGIDREPRWVDEATTRAGAAGLAERCTYRAGAAEALPFADAAFDLVTCQTLLMHVRDPGAVLREMVRVTRPGGLVIVAEPTNVTGPLVESIALGDAPETTAAMLGFLLTCQRGVKALGQGDHQIGEALPRLLHAVALRDVEIRQNDRAWVLAPPYTSPFERAQVDEACDAAERGRGLWDEATTRRFWLAGGGADDQFAARWSGAVDQRRRVADGIRAGTYCCVGGSFFYLAWGWRADAP